ncbi:putative protein OS=Eoetvoesiella caeni OX=645616 GN=DFR37_103221 PE=4 SV=1 [Eoetvoesiella caeni]
MNLKQPSNKGGTTGGPTSLPVGTQAITDQPSQLPIILSHIRKTHFAVGFQGAFEEGSKARQMD